jgi:molecular chaperone GrpE
MQGSDETLFEEVAEAEFSEETEPELPVANGEETAEPTPSTLEEQLAAAQAEADDYKDRWLRVQAEFANARKRMDRERSELYTAATAEVIKKLLPALDDLERALASVPEAIREDAWLEGMELVRRKLFSMLEQFNVTPIDAVGQPFDPNFHEAITQETADGLESGHVCRELQKGYKIGERVLRPSLVAVAE